MKKILLAICLMAMLCPAFSQELYVNTEPASNMATGSLGLRVENQGFLSLAIKTAAPLKPCMASAGR